MTTCAIYPKPSSGESLRDQHSIQAVILCHPSVSGLGSQFVSLHGKEARPWNAFSALSIRASSARRMPINLELTQGQRLGRKRFPSSPDGSQIVNRASTIPSTWCPKWGLVRETGRLESQEPPGSRVGCNSRANRWVAAEARMMMMMSRKCEEFSAVTARSVVVIFDYNWS